MEKGNLRADVNVSVRRPGDDARHPLRDQERQLDPLHRPGDRVRGAPPDRRSSRTAARSTRRRGCSIPTRARRARCARKEEAHDYRYFPDPDLLPLELTQAYVDELKAEPAGAARREEGALHRRLRAVAPTTPTCWSPSARAADYFEAGGRRGRDGQARGQLGDQRAVRAASTRKGIAIEASPVSSSQLGAIIDLIGQGTISGKIAKDLFEIVWTEGGDPAAHRRSARPEAGHRHRRDREGGRRRHRRQSRQGRAGQGQAQQRSAGSSAR